MNATVNPQMKVVDFLKQYGRMPVIRITPSVRGAEDKPASVQDIRNARRQAEYAQRRQGVKANLIQIWSA